MLKRLEAIDRRAKYLDRALPEPRVLVTLPDEEIFAPYAGLRISLSALASIERIYGSEAAQRGEEPIVTMVREAAHSGIEHSHDYNGILDALIQKEETRVGPEIFESIRAEIRREAKAGRSHNVRAS